MEESLERVRFATRLTAALDRVEGLYLVVLRAILLIVATMLLIGAIGWSVISLTRILRSPDSVVEQVSSVAASELTAPEQGSAAENRRDRALDDPLARERRYYAEFVKRYHALYQTRYQPALRAEDKRLSRGEFDDLTIDSASRLASVRNGELDFETDRRDLEAFLPIITEASVAAATRHMLDRYRTARKRRVTQTVNRIRIENRRGWDSLSTNCAGWYESPIGCAVNRRIEIPYTERVVAMRYPEGVESPNAVLKRYQDRYFDLLAERRRVNGDKAQSDRMDIAAGQVAGWNGLWQSTIVIGGFLVLMFFFLLVAIERHQRRFAQRLDATA